MTLWQLRRGLGIAGLALVPLALWTQARWLGWCVIALLGAAVLLRAATGWRQADPP